MKTFPRKSQPWFPISFFQLFMFVAGLNKFSEKSYFLDSQNVVMTCLRQWEPNYNNFTTSWVVFNSLPMFSCFLIINPQKVLKAFSPSLLEFSLLQQIFPIIHINPDMIPCRVSSRFYNDFQSLFCMRLGKLRSWIDSCSLATFSVNIHKDTFAHSTDIYCLTQLHSFGSIHCLTELHSE